MTIGLPATSPATSTRGGTRGGIARLGRIGAISAADALRPAKPKRIDLPDRPGGVRQLDVLPAQMREIAQRVGEKRAKRVWRLMERGIVASVPELCTYDWLERRKLTFRFQSAQMGGQLILGGAVVDFVIYDLVPEAVYVWRVMGEYWHTGREAEARDAEQKRRLLKLKIDGLPVRAVVDLWEFDIYDNYPEVFQLAEMGISLPGGR